MPRTLLCFVLITSFSLAQPTMAAERIALRQTKGVMTAGGFLSFPLEWDPVRGASFLVNLAPEFGIFLLDGFLLHSRVILKTPLLSQSSLFGDRNSQWFWGFGLGIKYSFNTTWPVIPYIGFDLNYSMAKLIITTASASIDIPAGIMVPLNEHVALSFGLKTSVLLVAQLKVFDRIRFEPGYLGINVFF
jgi:hypothetical protein